MPAIATQLLPSLLALKRILIARVSDPTVSHPFPPLPPCAPHVANVNVGSPNVFVEGLSVARIGDSTDSGAMTSGSGNVFANG